MIVTTGKEDPLGRPQPPASNSRNAFFRHAGQTVGAVQRWTCVKGVGRARRHQPLTFMYYGRRVLPNHVTEMFHACSIRLRGINPRHVKTYRITLLEKAQSMKGCTLVYQALYHILQDLAVGDIHVLATTLPTLSLPLHRNKGNKQSSMSLLQYHAIRQAQQSGGIVWVSWNCKRLASLALSGDSNTKAI